MRRPRPLAAGVAFIALVLALTLGPAPGADAVKRKQEVIFVGSNWEGTVEVIHQHGKYRRITQIDAIPDIDERMAEILTDPVRLGYFLGIRLLIGEGNDQFVDDMYTTPDGRLLVASRPSLADVVAINLRTREIAWRFEVDGQRSDHMAMSPNGRRVAVSASTGNVVHILNTRNGKEVGRFPSGDSPHENIYSEDGKRIYHASIGLVYTPLDQPALDTTKGERYFQVVNARTNKIITRVNMGERLRRAGYPQMSAAVRPMAIMPNERRAYMQVSFFHGFLEYDLKRQRVTRVAPLPNRVPDMPRENYLLDSAHHGIAMNGNTRRLCVAGTMSDYVALVSRKTFRYKLIDAGTKPYWATTTSDGTRCLVSWSGSDTMSVISYKTGREIARVPVGNHPQRVRMGYVRKAWIRAQR